MQRPHNVFMGQQFSGRIRWLADSTRRDCTSSRDQERALLIYFLIYRKCSFCVRCWSAPASYTLVIASRRRTAREVAINRPYSVMTAVHMEVLLEKIKLRASFPPIFSSFFPFFFSSASSLGVDTAARARAVEWQRRARGGDAQRSDLSHGGYARPP